MEDGAGRPARWPITAAIERPDVLPAGTGLPRGRRGRHAQGHRGLVRLGDEAARRSSMWARAT